MQPVSTKCRLFNSMNDNLDYYQINEVGEEEQSGIRSQSCRYDD